MNSTLKFQEKITQFIESGLNEWILLYNLYERDWLIYLNFLLKNEISNEIILIRRIVTALDSCDPYCSKQVEWYAQSETSKKKTNEPNELTFSSSKNWSKSLPLCSRSNPLDDGFFCWNFVSPAWDALRGHSSASVWVSAIWQWICHARLVATTILDTFGTMQGNRTWFASNSDWWHHSLTRSRRKMCRPWVEAACHSFPSKSNYQYWRAAESPTHWMWTDWSRECRLWCDLCLTRSSTPSKLPRPQS